MATAEQEIIETKPMLVTESAPIRSNFWTRFIGKQMVFQTKGRAIIKGTFKEFRNTFLLIEGAEVTGMKYKVKPKEVLLDRNFISHFHEECGVETTNGDLPE